MSNFTGFFKIHFHCLGMCFKLCLGEVILFKQHHVELVSKNGLG